MDNELSISNKTEISSMEMLAVFTNSTKGIADASQNKTVISSLDIVTAIYYFRQYPEVNVFLERFLANNKDYFLIQWVRATWDRLASMSEEEISELVINEMRMISNVEEEIA